MQKTVQLFTGDCKFKEMKTLIENGSCYDKLTIKQHKSTSYFLIFVNPLVFGYGRKKI